ncbi:MAG: hypothetical protein HQL91_04535 [Magnetococcales bacterium]|nr:hypothetical protein [Magnetococcales bacterium]
MTFKRIGMVTEGPTDQEVLRILLPAASLKVISYEFDSLQPRSDRTSSGGGQKGGWELVYKWCMNNHPELRRQMIVGGGLFSTSSSYDALLIHLDSDVCERISDNTNVDRYCYDLSGPVGRGQYVEAVLTDWLWPAGVDRDDLQWTIIAPAVESVESWLVAGLTQETTPEADKNPDLTLLRWDCQDKKRPFPEEATGISRKTSIRYKEFAKRAVKNIDRIGKKCPHFAALIQKVTAL